jgi:signal transduction histidine kinase/ActR/RegA family two-component response regulator
VEELVSAPEADVDAVVPQTVQPAPLTGFRLLPPAGQFYVGAVIVVGVVTFAAYVPRSTSDPGLFIALALWTCITSLWKVALPVGKVTGSTLSVSYSANLMTLLLLGPHHAVVTAVAGAWTQCYYRATEPAPLHRTLFSMSTTAITMAASGIVYVALGGEFAPTQVANLARPLVGAIGTYFMVNTTLIAGAVGMATRRTMWETWRHDFLWSGASFMVAGTAGAVAAIVIARGEHWKAALIMAPVYLAYRTYEVFVGRLDDERRHTEEAGLLHQQTMTALRQAHAAERELADEKERLAKTIKEMTQLQMLRDDLLVRERTARAHAEDASRIKDQFLAAVSHELRTPLSAILGWADMLRRDVLEMNSRGRAAQTIYQSAKLQAQLIDDLLDVARITSGKLRLERAAIDLRDPVQDALQIVQPGAEAKGVRMIVDIGSAAVPVLGDAARMQQIAWNLLSNAVKFTPEGGVVHVVLERSMTGAELRVMDSGQGISAEFLPRVFDAFRQEDATTTRVQPGLGLGLSIVKSLVEAHGGTITVHSDGLHRGATFLARFPIRSTMDRSAPAVMGQFASPEPAVILDRVSVLVVDDDESSREVIAAHLKCAHAEVVTAASAADAYELLREQSFDVLLADISMPDEDGYSFIRRVRSGIVPQSASTPAAALTAFAREEDRRQAFDAGFQLHLAKPVEAQLLVAAVANLHRCAAASTKPAGIIRRPIPPTLH